MRTVVGIRAGQSIGQPIESSSPINPSEVWKFPNWSS